MRHLAFLRRLLAPCWIFGLLFLVSACSMLPRSGPSTDKVSSVTQAPNGIPVAVVRLNPNVIHILNQVHRPGLADIFGSKSSPQEVDPRIGVGDEIDITIWEASPATLSASSMGAGSSGTGAVSLPEQTVSADGSVFLPFAGNVRVEDMTANQAAATIQGRLKGKLNQPQVLVSLVQPISSSVNVLGAVMHSGRFPLTARGEHVLDLLVDAGGPSGPLYETSVVLSRGGRNASMPLLGIIGNPSENVSLQPGDMLTVSRSAQSFIALGATGSNGEVHFDDGDLTLVHAVARAGGLLDARADPTGVFVFRLENPETVYKIIGHEVPPLAEDGMVPVIYQLDMAQPSSLFLAQRFNMQDNDILYVANAPVSQLQKFFQLLQTLTSPAVTWLAVENATD